MRGPIKRYSDYDDGARSVLSRTAKLAEQDGRTSIGTVLLTRGLLEVVPEARTTLADAGVHARVFESIDAEQPAKPGMTDAFRAVLDAAETAAVLANRRTVLASDLAAGLVAVAKRASRADAT